MEAMELFTRQYGLKDEQLLETLCGAAEVRHIPRGTVFLETGKLPTELFLLLRGMVGVPHRKQKQSVCSTPSLSTK